MKLVCPFCGSEGWLAHEQGSWLIPAQIEQADDEIICELDPFGQIGISSVVVAYACANETCDFKIEAEDLPLLTKEGMRWERT